MKRIAILQSNYIPWKGYFDMIAAVDEFILYDDVQFTKSDWRNRNQIKTPNGTMWLTIPVGSDLNRTIREVLLPDDQWRIKHLRALNHSYRSAPFYEEVMHLISPEYEPKAHSSLSSLNRKLTEVICGYLGITTKITNAWDYPVTVGKTSRLGDLCEQVGAQVYVSGPAAKSYLDVSLFADRGISVEWFDYSGYEEYSQLWGAFVPAVSVLDLLFNCGKSSPQFMKYVRRL